MIFQAAHFNRTSLHKIIEILTPEQLYNIPKGFKNNIIWNMGHILVTEQLLSYKLSGLELPIHEKYVKLYGKGSLPKKDVSTEDIEEVKTLLNAIKKTEKDYNNGVFKTYNTYPTSTGIVLKNIEDALQFNTFHEGIHLGIILSIKKLV